VVDLVAEYKLHSLYISMKAVMVRAIVYFIVFYGSIPAAATFAVGSSMFSFFTSSLIPCLPVARTSHASTHLNDLNTSNIHKVGTENGQARLRDKRSHVEVISRRYGGCDGTAGVKGSYAGADK
jgi:hypothetical protein